MKVFPGGKGSATRRKPRVGQLLAHVGLPLRYQIEIMLPAHPDHSEQRAWDAEITGGGEKTSIEFEARLYDVQAQHRRWHGKLRDDPPDHFLLVIANTAANRRVLRDYSELFADLPRLRTANVLKQLRRGQHPGTGLILI